MKTENTKLEDIVEMIKAGKDQLRTGTQRWLYELTIERFPEKYDAKIVSAKMGISTKTFYITVRQIIELLPWTNMLFQTYS